MVSTKALEELESFCKELGGRVGKAGRGAIACYLPKEKEICIDLDSNGMMEISVYGEGYEIYAPKRVEIPIDSTVIVDMKNARAHGEAEPLLSKARVSFLVCKKGKSFGFIGSAFEIW